MINYIEETFQDKSDWEDGPWKNEPDKASWIDEETWLDCLIVRNNSGALCGYVGVSENHPYYQTQYDQIEKNIDVHGGLTYSAFCQENGKICHKTDEVDQIWWFGFDCAHAEDIMPAHEKYYKQLGLKSTAEIMGLRASYKDMEYVKNEVKSLARQLKEIKY